IDDASTDGSSEKLLEYSDPRIRIFRREIPGPGGYAARNLGIEKAKYDWISFLDADDEWKTDYLAEVYGQISQFSNVDIVSTKWEVISENKKKDKESRVTTRSSYTLIDYLYNPKYMWTSAISIRK